MRVDRLAIFALAAVYVAALLVTAWVCDDAFITFRTIDNALAGHGLVWNVDERVQTYTHPLWMGLLLILSAGTGDIYAASLVLGIGLSLAALAFGMALARRRASGSLGPPALLLAIAIGSRAFVDYSTSGLENPLSHLLLVVLYAACLRSDADGRWALLRIGLFALCLCTRLDLVFLAAPLLLAASWRDGRPRLRAIALGLSPFVAWEIFSVVYYGSPIANSALAKLNSGLSADVLVPQGLHYLANSLRWDPWTGLFCVLGIAAGMATREISARSLAIGIVLQLCWVVWVGGDFMSGRFLSAPLWAASVVLVCSAPVRRFSWPLALAVVAVTLVVPYLSPFAERDYGPEWHAAIDDRGIADERHFHLASTALRSVYESGGWRSAEERERTLKAREHWNEDPWLAALSASGVLTERPDWPPRDPEALARARPVLVKGGVGLLGFRFGPEVHVLDYHGLCDPLLARLPAVESDPVLALLIPRLGGLRWRVGHYLRRVPSGYAESLSARENRIVDPDLAEVYAVLRRVTRGPLFAGDRWAAIWQLNSGGLDAQIELYLARHP